MSKDKATPPNTDAIIKKLRLFNEKADLLRTRSYIKQAENQEVSIRFDSATEQATLREIRPDEEARESVLLTLRFFYNELKFKQIIALYDHLSIPEETKASALAWVNEFERLMTTGMWFTWKINERPFSPREIFISFMFGYHCHPQESLAANVDLFKQEPVMWALIQQEFDNLIRLHLNLIFELAKVNAQVISELEKAASS
jgi:hypothetical protein